MTTRSTQSDESVYSFSTDDVSTDEVTGPARFRILVIGRANAGKTTILRAVCGTDEEPEVFDEKGRMVELNVTSTRPKFRSIRKFLGKWGKQKASSNPLGEDSTSVISPSSTLGLHNIEYSLVFPSNSRFVFHDSRGFESGATEELELVWEFINNRATKGTMDGQLHAI